MHTCAQTRTSFRLLRVQSSKTLSDPFSVAEFAEKMSAASEDNSPQARVADSSSRNAVSFSSARTTTRFRSSRCQIHLGRDRMKDGVTQGDQYDVVTHASYYTERSTDTDYGISNTSRLSPDPKGRSIGLVAMLQTSSPKQTHVRRFPLNRKF